MRISDWSSDVCSSDLPPTDAQRAAKMASMPDCMAAMEKTSDKRCDCTRADCIAAMMGGASVLTLADLDGAPKTLVAPSLRPLPAPTVPLAGRNVGPEPDAPNSLI